MTTAAPARTDVSGAPAPESSPGTSATAVKTSLGMQSISDVVFGLALSIGSVILISKIPGSTDELVSDILSFGFSFLIVIVVWTGYRRAILALPHETQATVLVNVALLFVVSIEPFLFWVMAAASANPGSVILEPASVAYALDVGLMILLQWTFNLLLVAEERAAPRKQVPSAVLDRIQQRMWPGIAVAFLFFASALPFFWIRAPGNSYLRIDMWYAGLVLIFLLPRFVARGKEREGRPKEGKTANR